MSTFNIGLSLFSFPFSCALKFHALFRESEGSFQYGNYRKEANDLRAVICYILAEGREIIAIAGHSKGK